MIADPQDLFRLLKTPGIELTNLLFAGDEVVWVTWKYVEEEENMPLLVKRTRISVLMSQPGRVSNCTPNWTL
jgi:hypothetical protein